MAMSGIGKKGVRSEINITPYIDILLVLLVIFMVSTPLKQYDLPVRVPQPAPPKQEKEIKSDAIIVDIDSDHSIKINMTPVTMEDLGSTIFRIYSARPNKNMWVRGDSKLAYGEVFKVMEIAKHSGAGEIAMLVREAAPKAADGK